MPNYFVKGGLGSGKSLIVVSKIREYLAAGRPVATNMDLFVEYLTDPFATDTKIYRVSDTPTIEELKFLPRPYEGKYNESLTGLLVLDEAINFLDPRSWSDKSRKPMIRFLVHIRKKGWDVMLVAQDEAMIDSQIRSAMCEHVVICRRLDRLKIPFVTWFTKLLGFEVRPPKSHLATVRFGQEARSPVVDTWLYRGTDLYEAYDTEQVLLSIPDVDSVSLHSVLPANYIYGRYTNLGEHQKRRFINSFNGFLNSKKPRGFFFLGLFIAFFISFFSYAFNFVYSYVYPVEQAVTNKVAEASKSSNKNPFDGVFITASVSTSTSYDYVFESATGAIEPQYMGYKVDYMDECHAILRKGVEVHDVRCNPNSVSSTGESDGVLSDAKNALTETFGFSVD